MRINGGWLHLEPEALAELSGFIEDFTRQHLELLERDVKEVAGAAHGIEHFQVTKLRMEGVDGGAGVREPGGAGVSQGDGADVRSLGAERLGDGGQDEGARRRRGA